MLNSIRRPDIQAVFDQARSPRTRRVKVGDKTVAIPTPFPSPADWRDKWIYFLLVDRFNNPAAPPRHPPWDGEHGVFQGGTFNGIRAQLGYLQELGVGAIWLSPVLKNCQYNPFTYHGYGIQDFSQVDPRFASDPEAARANPRLAEGELRHLVDEAHARGIYVIFDIVLNHVGDVFEYKGHGSDAPWSDRPYTIYWRDEKGKGNPAWTEPPADPNLPADAAVGPAEVRHNEFFRRQGVGGESGGDFYSLKELVTDFREGGYYPVRDILIRAYQYLIAKYDVDGLRIDTLKFVEPDFARVFGNAIREFALSIGKKDFFTFGEVYDSEEKIARFVGRNAIETGDLTGVDAALDFPLFYNLPGAVKGMLAPVQIVNVFERRQRVQRGIISSHGEASKFFVTFLDNHDQHTRFYYRDPGNPTQYDEQLTLGVCCLFALQGIPCLYYGTEQGLHGAGGTPEAVREALWGKSNAFDCSQPFYRAIQQLTAVRNQQPGLRYGRQYFRPISGNGVNFGISDFPAGVLAFSRILNDQEVVVIANTNSQNAWAGEVIVDFAINPVGSTYGILFSNKSEPANPGPVVEKPANRVEVHEIDGTVTRGPIRGARVELQPMEIQILGRTE